MDKIYSYHYKLNLASDKLADVAYHANDETATGEHYHFHDGLEIIQTWCEDGLVLVEDSVYPMRNGNVYFFNAQDIHCTTPANSSQYVRSKLTFSPLFISGLLNEIDQMFLLDFFFINKKKISHCISPNEATMMRFDELLHNISLECYEKRIGHAAIVRAHLLELLVLIQRELKMEEQALMAVSPTHNHIMTLLKYINLHLTEEISFDALYKELHLSKYHICHIFKTSTGMTISQYIVNRRISESKRLLLMGKPISEVALETGFSSFSLFTRTFKKITGTNPSTFRKNQV